MSNTPRVTTAHVTPQSEANDLDPVISDRLSEMVRQSTRLPAHLERFDFVAWCPVSHGDPWPDQRGEARSFVRFELPCERTHLGDEAFDRLLQVITDFGHVDAFRQLVPIVKTDRDATVTR